MKIRLQLWFPLMVLVSRLTFGALIHFEFIIVVYGVKYSNFIYSFVCGNPVVLALFVAHLFLAQMSN